MEWICLIALPACSPTQGPDAYAELRKASQAMGLAAAEGEAPVVVLFASGRQNKTAEGQGYSPGTPSWGRLVESLSVDLSGRAVAREYEERRYDGTTERFGEAFPSNAERTLLIRDFGVAVPFIDGAYSDAVDALRRRLPHALLQELTVDSASLEAEHGAADTVLIRTRFAGEPAVVTLDPSGRIAALSYSTRLPVHDSTRIEWWFRDYRPGPGGLAIPHSYGSTVGGVTYTDMSVDSVRLDGEFALSLDGLRLLEPREAPSAAVGSHSPLEAETIGPGVFRVPDVRSGFAPLVVEFDEFLIVVDAPASFPLLAQIPAGETDPGPSSEWVTQRLVDFAKSAWPDKPIRYGVLTHHHDDHAGGASALVEAGAVIVGGAATISAIPDLALAETQVVTDPIALGDATRSMTIIPVGDNPHAEGMVVVQLPEGGGLFVSDLVTPAPGEGYPGANHEALDRWFAGWLHEQQPALPMPVYSMHGSGTFDASHLERLRAERLRP